MKKKSAHSDILSREAAHWGAKMKSKLGNSVQRVIRHASMEEFARHSCLNKLFAKPFLEKKGVLRVLELGFGTGGNAIRLARLGHKVTAIDIFPESFQYGEQGARA
jgi:2-polyprenyl-3-methyl-5-hydroxy-6-metoxy-1,4-benzoquinol methylase